MILNYESEKDGSISHRDRILIKENLNRLKVKNVNLNQQAVLGLGPNINSKKTMDNIDSHYENRSKKLE